VYPPIVKDTLPLKNRAGETLMHVRRQTAERLISKELVIPKGTKHRTHALLLAPQFDDSVVVSLLQYAGQRYVHRRETAENPPRVWMHKRVLLHG